MSPRAFAVALVLVASVFARSAAALTADEVLRLKAAGVSDHTIQMMMKDEQADAANAAGGPPPGQAQTAQRDIFASLRVNADAGLLRANEQCVVTFERDAIGGNV